jgi:hypothetical protein
MKREWKDVRGLVGRYQVSDDGYVRSLPDIDLRGRFMTGCILKAGVTEKGYLHVSLGGKSYRVHRLVAQAFISNPDKLPQVNHKDGVKSNNHWLNLEWSTNGENQKHRYRVLKHTPHLLGRTGSLCPNSKPIEGRCVKTGKRVRYAGASEAARALGLRSGASISMAANGRLRTSAGYIWSYVE